MHVVEVVPDVLLLEAFDQVLPAHPEPGLVDVDGPVRRVFDIGGDGEVEQVVGAVAILAELVHQLLPENNIVF